MAAAKRQPRFSAVIPILNRECKIPTSVPIQLCDNMSFRRIKADDLVIITEKDDDAYGIVKGGINTITIDNFNPEIADQDLDIIIKCAMFSLNVMGNGLPLAVHKIYVIRRLYKSSIYATRFALGHNHANSNKFEIPKKEDLGVIQEIYKSALASTKVHTATQITISRYNSAIGRNLPDDRLIDLCIALESVVSTNSEISFQFALYNTILSENDIEKRTVIFKLLKKMYSERSNLVHGNKPMDIQWFNDNWSDLVKIAQTSILKKIDFLSRNNHESWRKHLEKLVLGSDNGENNA